MVEKLACKGPKEVEGNVEIMMLYRNQLLVAKTWVAN